MYLLDTKTVKIISDRKVGYAMQGWHQESLTHVRGINTISFACMISEAYDSEDKDAFVRKLPFKVRKIITEQDELADWLISHAW